MYKTFSGKRFDRFLDAGIAARRGWIEAHEKFQNPLPMMIRERRVAGIIVKWLKMCGYDKAHLDYYAQEMAWIDTRIERELSRARDGAKSFNENKPESKTEKECCAFCVNKRSDITFLNGDKGISCHKCIEIYRQANGVYPNPDFYCSGFERKK
jgi:hypothetical protein